MLLGFRWIAWNLDHIARHGISRAEAEFVVWRAEAPYPAKIEDEKYLVRGQDSTGRYIQVIYILSPEDTVFVIHARPLTDREKRRYRRRRR